jgi:ABC-type antimicrobial peptide transport system permease subunit
VPATMVVVSVLAALGPALLAARLRPAEALRHL